MSTRNRLMLAGLSIAVMAFAVVIAHRTECCKQEALKSQAAQDAARSRELAELQAKVSDLADDGALQRIEANADCVVDLRIFGEYDEETELADEDGVVRTKLRTHVSGELGSCTAFVLPMQKNADGSEEDRQFLLSVAHFIEDKTIHYVWAVFRDELNLPPESVDLVGYDHVRDLTLMRFRKGFRFPGKTFPIGDSDRCKPPDAVVAIGCPLKTKYFATEGILGDTTYVGVNDNWYPRVLMHSAIMTDGNSGGPLVLKKTGEVIGINGAMMTSSHQCLFGSVPINEFKRDYEQLKHANSHEVLHAKITDAIFENSWSIIPTDAAALGITIPAERCVIVTAVDGHSPAGQAGLLPGDIVESFNGNAPKDYTDLWEMVLDCAPQTVAELKVRRGVETRTCTMQLGVYQNDPYSRSPLTATVDIVPLGK